MYGAGGRGLARACGSGQHGCLGLSGWPTKPAPSAEPPTPTISPWPQAATAPLSILLQVLVTALPDALSPSAGRKAPRFGSLPPVAGYPGTLPLLHKLGDLSKLSKQQWKAAAGGSPGWSRGPGWGRVSVAVLATG